MVAAVRSPGMAADLQQLQQKHPASAQGTCKLHITTLDVANPASIKAWASSLRDKCPGLRHVDVVINNAGGEVGPLLVTSGGPLASAPCNPRSGLCAEKDDGLGLVRPWFSRSRAQRSVCCSIALVCDKQRSPGFL